MDFKMEDIDCLFCKVFCLSKIVLNINKYYMEDVYCVGGIMGLLGELDCVGLIYKNIYIVLGLIMGD